MCACACGEVSSGTCAAGRAEGQRLKQGVLLLLPPLLRQGAPTCQERERPRVARETAGGQAERFGAAGKDEEVEGCGAVQPLYGRYIGG